MLSNREPPNDNSAEIRTGMKFFNDIYFFGLIKSFSTKYIAAKIENKLNTIV